MTKYMEWQEPYDDGDSCVICRMSFEDVIKSMKKYQEKTFNDLVHERFELVCKKCGSTNVVIDYTEEYTYSEYTQGASSVTIGCNDCRQNDFYSY